MIQLCTPRCRFDNTLLYSIIVTPNFVTECPTLSIKNGRFPSIEEAYSKQKGNLRVDISGVISAGENKFPLK